MIAKYFINQNIIPGEQKKKKNGTTTHVVVPSQHKHKIKHDKTTMQSFLSMPGRHKYYLRIFAYS